MGPSIGNMLFEDLGKIHMMVLRHQVQRRPKWNPKKKKEWRPPGVILGCHIGAVLLHMGPGKTHLTVPQCPLQHSLPGVVLGCQISATLLHKKLGKIHMTAL